MPVKQKTKSISHATKNRDKKVDDITNLANAAEAACLPLFKKLHAESKSKRKVVLTAESLLSLSTLIRSLRHQIEEMKSIKTPFLGMEFEAISREDLEKLKTDRDEWKTSWNNVANNWHKAEKKYNEETTQFKLEAYEAKAALIKAEKETAKKWKRYVSRGPRIHELEAQLRRAKIKLQRAGIKFNVKGGKA